MESNADDAGVKASELSMMALCTAPNDTRTLLLLHHLHCNVSHSLSNVHIERISLAADIKKVSPQKHSAEMTETVELTAHAVLPQSANLTNTTQPRLASRVRCTVESSGNRAFSRLLSCRSCQMSKCALLRLYFFKGFYCVSTMWVSLTSLSIGLVSQLFFCQAQQLCTVCMTVLVITSNYMFAAIQSFAGSTDFGHYASRLSSKGDLLFDYLTEKYMGAMDKVNKEWDCSHQLSKYLWSICDDIGVCFCSG